MARNVWTPKLLAQLKELYPYHSNKEIGKLLGFSDSSVKTQGLRMRLRKSESYKPEVIQPNALTQDEIEFIRKNFLSFTNGQLAAKIGRSVAAVKTVARKFKLKKPTDGRFKKGNVSWIKGKKMQDGWGGETRFKKGNIPHNTLPIGSIIVRKYVDGSEYQWKKVSEKQWRQLSYVVYEEHNQPIPSGFIVAFKDGNTLNCAPDNLILKTKAEHMSVNTIMRFPPELIQHHPITKQVQTKN